MKKIVLLGLTSILSGCITPTTQMLNNKFSEVSSKSPAFSGIWTTSIGPGLSTIKLESDGNGVLCEDTSGHVQINKIKILDNTIYVQNGMKLQVLNLNKDVLEAKTTLTAFNVNLVYKADNDLKNASIKCAKEI